MTGIICPWASVCSLKAGSGELLLFEPGTLQELRNCLQKSAKTPLILGHGTNLVGSDSQDRIPALRLGKGRDFAELAQIAGNRFRAGCGLGLAWLLTKLASLGFGGYAGLCGIPGTLGGALAMNAGANGQEISSAVQQIDGWDMRADRSWTWHREQGGWAYRQSPIPPGVLALQAVLQLQQVDPAAEKSLLAAEHQRRKKITPPGASAGSVFRNPAPDLPAGRLLEQAGCKGLTAGKFSVSSQHANWIVNLARKPGNAQDCRTLTEEMQRKVGKLFSIELHCEWRWADDPACIM